MRKSDQTRLSEIYASTIVLLLPPLLIFFVTASTTPDQSLYDEWWIRAVNRYVPIYSLGVLASTCYRIIRQVPEALWTPFVWFPFQSAIFFVFGTMVGVWGSAETLQSRMFHPLTIDMVQLLNVNLLLGVGIPLVLAGMYGSLAWLPDLKTEKAKGQASKFLAMPDKIVPIALLTIFAGGLFRYGLMKPMQWGMIDGTLSGVFSSMGFVIDLGFAMLAYCVGLKGGRSYAFLLALLLPIHLILSLFSFAKLEIVVALMLPVLGLHLARRRMHELAIGTVVVVVAYILAGPIVTHGRTQLTILTGDLNQGTYSDRAGAVASYFTAPETTQMVRTHTPNIQGWWMRLDFAGPIANAMELHRLGQVSNSLETAWMRFVPRLIWPDKPILAGPGAEFYSLILGRETSTLVGLSIYGDAFWQYGWKGIFVICPIVGFCFGFVGRHTLKWVTERSFLFFPLVFYVILWSADGPSKYLVNGFIGSMPLIAAYWIAMSFIHPYLNIGRQGARRRRVVRTPRPIPPVSA
ncbi:hypothetical protein PB2503_11339 [Parvularcula bermudensis HTCC2503]|uniref:Oligosaccharide repeat unit polymerase n=2 Tax=Parvularcula TaxID=208215 RepID=E0TC57_PARBH|nr:hypothetical protein PB2503_11339 [Parvularcula bermudensis HTCC2503]